MISRNVWFDFCFWRKFAVSAMVEILKNNGGGGNRMIKTIDHQFRMKEINFVDMCTAHVSFNLIHANARTPPRYANEVRKMEFIIWIAENVSYTRCVREFINIFIRICLSASFEFPEIIRFRCCCFFVIALLCLVSFQFYLYLLHTVRCCCRCTYMCVPYMLFRFLSTDRFKPAQNFQFHTFYSNEFCVWAHSGENLMCIRSPWIDM